MVVAKYIPEIWFPILLITILGVRVSGARYFEKYLINCESVFEIRKRRKLYMIAIIVSGVLLLITFNDGMPTLLDRYSDGYRLNIHESVPDYYDITTTVYDYKIGNPTLEILLDYSKLIIMIIVFIIASSLYNMYGKRIRILETEQSNRNTHI
jgi:hypothetical protein